MNKEFFANNKQGQTCKIDFHLKYNFYISSESNNLYLHDVAEEEIDQYGLLQSHYEELISSHVLTTQQNTVFLEVITRLVHGCECPSLLLSSLEFSFSEEEGIIIHRSSDQGVSFIAIDNEGDSMFSFSPYQGKGKRLFFDYGSDSTEVMAYHILAK